MKSVKKVKDEEFAKMERVHKPFNKYVDKKFYFYFSYGLRVALMFLSVVIIAVVAYKCFNESFSEGKNIELKYQEKGNINYNAILFDNNPFETGTLEPVDSYISELVDKISLDLKYEYALDDKVDVNYSHYVVISRELKDEKGNIISKTEQRLMQKEEKEQTDTDKVEIDQNVILDYYDYNNQAAALKNEYGLDIYGNINVKMFIEMNTKYDKFEESINKEQVLEVNIPLLSSQVKVDLVKAIDNSDSYVEHEIPKLVVPMTLYVGITLLIIDTVFLLLAISFIFRSTPKKSKYTSLRDGLLRDYDRVIVNCNKLPNLEGYNVVDCYNFSELMDAQRLLEKPILYYEVTKNQKCVFIILGNNDVYRFVLKECDLEF